MRRFRSQEAGNVTSALGLSTTPIRGHRPQVRSGPVARMAVHPGRRAGLRGRSRACRLAGRMGALSLIVQAGPDKGRQIPVGDAPVSIGRGAGEDLQLTDGAVSRHHLAVQADPGGLRVVEVSGVNPVWTVEAGQRVPVRVGQVLAPGAAVTIGATTLVVREAAAEAPPAKIPGRGVELDATRVISGAPEASRLAALAAL